jgi:hypothetical protein
MLTKNHVMPCRLINSYTCFGGAYCVYLQDIAVQGMGFVSTLLGVSVRKDWDGMLLRDFSIY